MTENSDPLEDAVAEGINKTLKEEFTLDKQISFGNFNEAKSTIKQIINFYNNERPHRSLEMNTPNYAYQINKALKRKWKTYYRSVNKDIEIIVNIIKEKNINNTCSESY